MTTTPDAYPMCHVCNTKLVTINANRGTPGPEYWCPQCHDYAHNTRLKDRLAHCIYCGSNEVIPDMQEIDTDGEPRGLCATCRTEQVFRKDGWRPTSVTFAASELLRAIQEV